MAYGTDLPKCHSRGWELPTSAGLLARSASVPEDVEPTLVSRAGIQNLNFLSGTLHSGLKHGFVSPEAMQDDGNFPRGGHGCFLVPFALG